VPAASAAGARWLLRGLWVTGKPERSLDTHSAKQIWAAIYDRFAPHEPAQGPVRVPRADYNTVQSLVSHFSRPFGERRYLLAGPTGSGKSTELLRLTEQLTDARIVVFFDVWQHLSDRVLDPAAIDRLTPAEVVGLVGLAIHRAAVEGPGLDLAPEAQVLAEALRGLARAGAEWMGTPEASISADVDVAKLAGEMTVWTGGWVDAAVPAMGTAMRLLAAAANHARWTLPLGAGARGRHTDQHPLVRSVVEAVEGLLAAIKRQTSRRVLLIVDGLDRMTDPSAFEALFVRSRALVVLPCDSVFTVDASALQRYPGMLAGFDAAELACLPVRNHQRPEEHGSGIAFFRELFARRLSLLDLKSEDVIAADVLDDLAFSSGGRVRDFMHLVRELASLSYEDPLPASRRRVDEAIRLQRLQRESGINAGEIRVLHAVMDDPSHRLPEDPVARTLLHQARLLSYPNESTWYYPHPLLTRSLLRRDRA
jgi:hypothetical protein